MSKFRGAVKLLQRSTFIKESALSNKRCAATAAVAAEKQNDAALASAKPFEEIPSVLILPVIGSAWIYLPIIGRYRLDKQHLAFRHKKQMYGDILREKFGPLNMVISYRPEDLETVFRNDGPYPSRGELTSLKAYREIRKEWYSTGGLIVLQGKEWHQLRTKIQKHLLKPKAIIAYLEPMQNVARDFVAKVFKIRDSNKEVPNLLGELYKWSLESVALVALDTRLGCLEVNLLPDSDGLKMITSVQTQLECMNRLEAFTGNIQFWKLFPTPTWKKFVKAADVFSEIAFKYINRSFDELKRNEGDEDKELTLLQSMLATKELDVSEAMVTVADMLMAGIDSTSHTVGFLLYNLARNPEKQEILYQEIVRNLPAKEDRITPQIYNELKYLKACVKESHRLTPIVFGNARSLDHEVVIGGYRVPPQTVIAVALQEVGLDERYFKNAKSYIPERWLSKDEKIHPFALVPFGFGTRSCIGRRLAELEIISLTTEIIRNFKVEYHHEDIDIVTRLVITPDRPLRFNFIER